MSILADLITKKPLEAIVFFKRKGYALSWNWYDTWKQAHTRAFTVAKVMKADILQDIRSMINKAQSDGITFQQFKKELAPRLQEKGWWGKKEIVDTDTGLVTQVQLGSVRRLQTIYQTNLQTSYMAGRYKQQVESGMPYMQYLSVIDGQTTDRCRSMHLRTFAATDPVWDTLYPPNHWNCRARVRTLTQSKVIRENISIDDSTGKLVTKTATIGKDEDKRQVQVTGFKINDGSTFWPDPGWDYNPGKSDFKPDLSRYDTDIQSQLNADLNP